ncbi:MAG: Zn-ribbon domain-containing OB-fold protein [Actinomycetia bacterium]|nr:Zn-ribbon domain-containing OB-fold protein [Actinomycetes bacterium]
MTDRPIPVPTPETQHFWDGTREGELRLQQCVDCSSTYFPPRAFCPACSSRNVEVVASAGRGTLHSYVINQRERPGFTAPYAVAVVELDEGPRMMTNIVGCEQTPETLVLDMPVEVVFEELSDDISLPLFQPVEGSGS